MLSDSPAQTGLASIATGPWQPQVLRAAAHTRPGACWVSMALVSPGEGLGCSCHHLNEHPLSQEAIALQCLWCSPGKREGETSRKGKPTATPRHEVVAQHRPGARRLCPHETPQRPPHLPPSSTACSDFFRAALLQPRAAVRRLRCAGVTWDGEEQDSALPGAHPSPRPGPGSAAAPAASAQQTCLALLPPGFGMW